MELADLTVKNRKIDYSFMVGGVYTIRFRAEDVRQERTGIHAKLLIGADNSLCAWDNFNIERNSERVRLANGAHSKFQESLQILYTAKQLQHDLDIFATLVYPKWVETMIPSLVVGFSERSLPQFRLQPYIVKGGGTILFGPPERMKTMTAMTMAICIDAGLAYPFADVEQSPVLYVNLERPDGSMQRRLGDLNRALGLEPERPILMLNARGKSLPDVEQAIEKAVYAKGVKVGFLDSISRAGYGDQIDNRTANMTIDIMNGLFDSWVGIAHSPRNDATHMFGSMHFEAGADIIVQLLTEYKEERIGVGLKVVKSNDMARPNLGGIGFEFDDFGVKSIWRPQTSDFPQLLTMSDSRGGLEEEIEDYLLEHGAADAQLISENTDGNRGSVAKILSASNRFVVVRKDGHKVLYGVKG